MKLYVTRHGQTAWNRENIVCGVTDLPLDETGMEQARETARKLKDTPIDRVIVSPLLRARQTAALICEGRDLPVMIDPRIKEQNYGVYELSLIHILLKADQLDTELGYVGEIREVNVDILRNAAGNGYVPIVSTLSLIHIFHLGEASAEAYGCDLTYDYVKINGDYRT